MIEFCNKRRMIFSIIGLAVLTLIVVLLEENITSEARVVSSPPASPSNVSKKHNKISGSDQSPCWTIESFTVVQKCSMCSEFEINSNTPQECKLTGMKEVIKCVSGETKYRSCSTVTKKETIAFWVFELLSLVMVIVFYGFVKLRTSVIERQTIRSIEKRLAAGL